MRVTADQLALLAAVADAGTVTGAAASRNVSQPAVSNRLRALETNVGQRLVVRTGRGIALTDEGRSLLPHARAIARALQRAEHSLVEPDLTQVSVAISETAVPVIVPLFVAAERAGALREPRVVSRDASSAGQAVTSGEVDFAVAIAMPEPAGDDLQRRPLLLDEIVLVRAPGARRAVATLGELEGAVLLWQGLGSGVRATVERMLETAGIWPSATFELGSSLGVLAAAAAGLGVGLLPRSYVAPWVEADRVSVASFRAAELQAHYEVISPPLSELGRNARQAYETLLQAPLPRELRRFTA